MEDVKETATFSNAAVINLRYQYTQLTYAGAVSNFYDSEGNRVSVDFLKAGDVVTEVEWISSNTYRNPSSRTLIGDEIAAVKSGSNLLIPVTGAVLVQYSTSSDMYRVTFEVGNTDISGAILDWKTAYVHTYDGINTGILFLYPPTLKET
jgi:hypothetical protein